jgi:tetratricopeptide (TPR) repeat protein
MGHQTNETTELVRHTTEDLRRGDLTMRQMAGITPQEMVAMAETADALRRSGDLDGAAAVWGLLLSYDPYVPRYWKALADIHRRRSRWAEAVACYELLALVQDRILDDARAEATCLFALGEGELGRLITADTEGRTTCGSMVTVLE